MGAGESQTHLILLIWHVSMTLSSRPKHRPRKKKLQCMEIRILEKNDSMYRFAYSLFPSHVLSTLGKYWTGSVTGTYKHIYISQNQIYRVPSELWTVSKTTQMTLLAWKKLKKAHLQ